MVQAVLVATIPVVAGFLTSYIKTKSAHFAELTQNEKTRLYLGELSDAVITAVAQTSQTYVDELKRNGTFSKDAQMVALEKAKKTAIATLSPAAKSFLEQTYMDLQALLDAKIEEAVREQKAEGNA